MTTRTFTLAVLAAAGLGLTAAQAQATATQQLDISGRVNAPNASSGATLRQSGPFRGSPFGSGTLKVTTSIGQGKGAKVGFRLITKRGQVWGAGNVKLTFRGMRIVYNGTARITGGSGAFKGMRGSGLRLTGGGSLTGANFPMRLTGRVSR